MEKKRSKYDIFMEAYKRAFKDDWNAVVHKKGQDIWKTLKEDPDLIQQKINEYNIKATNLKTQKLKIWQGYRKITPSTSKVADNVETLTQTATSSSKENHETMKEKNVSDIKINMFSGSQLSRMWQINIKRISRNHFL